MPPNHAPRPSTFWGISANIFIWTQASNKLFDMAWGLPGWRDLVDSSLENPASYTAARCNTRRNAACGLFLSFFVVYGSAAWSLQLWVSLAAFFEVSWQYPGATAARLTWLLESDQIRRLGVRISLASYSPSCLIWKDNPCQGLYQDVKKWRETAKNWWAR